MLSIFKSLAVVDYGSNVPIPPDSEYVDGGYVDGHLSCEPGQFMAWFYLPSLRKLWIWLQDYQEILACKRQTSFDRVRSLVLVRPTIREEEAIFLLYLFRTPKRLHLVMELPGLEKLGKQRSHPGRPETRQRIALFVPSGHMLCSIIWSYCAETEFKQQQLETF